jgi:alkylation response protein AidB-like acyl-CoA dehydrogenase
MTDIRQEIRGLAEKWAGRYEPQVDCWMRSADSEFTRDLAERSLIGITWPTAFGGRAASNVERLQATEELLRAGLPVGLHWIADRQIGPAILRSGTERLQREILPLITGGLAATSLGMSEPDAGSDLAAVETRAVKVDGGWLISGRKIWTTLAHRATHLYVLTRTDEGERKQEGLTEFIVDADSPGIEITPIIDLSGEHHFNEVALREVFAPDHRLIGERGNGWKQVTEQLAFERGGAERVLSTYPLLAAMLAEGYYRRDEGALRELGAVVTRLASLRYLCRHIALDMDAGEAPIRLAAALKLLGTAFEAELIEVVRRLVPNPTQQLARMIESATLASPGFAIRGGASDVLLSIITRLEVPRTGASPTFSRSSTEGGAGSEEIFEMVTDVVDAPNVFDVDRSAGRLAELAELAAELGWVGISIDERHGGSGGDLGDAAAVLRGLARYGLDVGVDHAMLAFYTERFPDDEEGLRLREALYSGAILIGAAEGAYEMTKRYVTERQQFGRPLIAVPAVGAKLSTMRVEIDLAIAGFERAVVRSGLPDAAGAMTAARLGRAVAAEAAGHVAATAHTLHGAMGVTIEYPLHHFTTLLWRTRDRAGSQHADLVALGRAVVDGGEVVLWDELTSNSFDEPVSFEDSVAPLLAAGVGENV